jgi:DNA-binding transcriptional regulator YhcF (GntR family)
MSLTVLYGFKVNPNENQPIYQQLAFFIRNLILSRHLAPGTKFPSTSKIAENLKIQVATVQGAFRVLVKLGFPHFYGQRGMI